MKDPRMAISTMARVAIMLIALVVVFTTLDQAQGFFAPVFSALVVGIILSPLSNFWDRIGLRTSFAALATVISPRRGLTLPQSLWNSLQHPHLR
jgi:predicted PurR-regulated permease PerM